MLDPELVSLLSAGIAQNLSAIECLLKREIDKDDPDDGSIIDHMKNESEKTMEFLKRLQIDILRALASSLGLATKGRLGRMQSKIAIAELFRDVPLEHIKDALLGRQ